MQEDIRQALVLCSRPRNEEERKANEKIIRGYKKENPSEFIYYMAQELNNEDLNEEARHLAGVLFKNSVSAGDPMPYWFNFNEEQAIELKKLILAPMNNISHSVRLATCNCIATVACLELPNKKWPEIVKILWESSFDSDINKKLSALMTLGYICEELDGDSLEKESADLIISALLEAVKELDQPEVIMKTAANAVLHCLSFAEKNFEQNEGGIIIERILNCAEYNSVPVRCSIMMCLAEIVRLYYPHIDSYMEQITTVTFTIMKEDFDDEIKTLAIEVWCSLSEEEIYLKKRNQEECKNYIETVFHQLLQIMLNLLNTADIDEDDEADNWNTSTAAGCCLHLMSLNVGDQIIEEVIAFVESKIGENAGWKDKYFGLLALGAILEGPSKNKLINVLEPAMGIILNLYNDQSRKIRATTAWFFSRVAQNHCELLGTETLFPSLCEKVVMGLKDETKVACNSATIITELAKSLAPVEGQNRNILSGYYEDLIKHVLECAYRLDELKQSYGRSENKITIAGFDALYSLFEYAPPDVENLLLSSLENFYNLLKEVSVKKDQLDDRSKDLQSFICVCLQTILNRMTEALPTTVADSFIQVIIDCFDARGDVFEEGFLLLSALCSKFGKYMDNFVERLGPYIIHALKNSDSSDTIKNACGLISDLCTMVESEKIIDGFEQYVPLLHEIMINPKLQRDAKLSSVTAIGDTYLITREKFLPFLDNTMKLFASAAEQCVDMNKNDEDLLEYIFKLQGALIESYTCIVQEAANANEDTYRMIEQYIPGIVKFCIICINERFSPTLARLKEVAGLIGDLASTYQKKEYFPISEIEQIVKFLKDSQDVEANSIGDWIISNVSNILNSNN